MGPNSQLFSPNYDWLVHNIHVHVYDVANWRIKLTGVVQEIEPTEF